MDDLRPNRDRTILNGALTIFVREYGRDDGPAVILLHGISNRSDDWLPVLPALVDRFRVLAMDLRGHGGSSHPVMGYRHADYADDLQAVIEAYNLTSPLLVGHSLGGIVALEWATRHAGVAAGIIAEDPPLSSGAGIEATFATWISMNQLPLESLLVRYRVDLPHLPEAQVRRRAESMAETELAVFREELAAARSNAEVDSVARLAGVTSPILLVYGDLETGGMVAPDDIRRLTETVPNAEAARIARGTHSLHRDRPDDFLRLIIPFLNEHAPDR